LGDIFMAPEQHVQIPMGGRGDGRSFQSMSSHSGVHSGNPTDIIPSDVVPVYRNRDGAEDAKTAAALDTAEPMDPLLLSPAMERMPVRLAVSVPVREFRVRRLLSLGRDDLIETQWGHGDDLPLASGDVQLAWSEFEVVDTRLAVRITRLA
jgi:flagellar motor switch protein FliN/FliY